LKTFIKVSEEMGRGVYAGENAEAGTVVSQCEILLLDQDDTASVNKTSLQYYTFKYDTDRDCIVLGDGEIFNHSDNANVSYALTPFENRMVMTFRTLRTIEAGEQLFINYSADTTADVNAYIAKASLLG
jgi:uncharacterized protein